MSVERAMSPRKAVYSVTEVAALCGISRARFYDLIRDGVMPLPLYCLRTRRPFYPADVASLCVRVRESNVGIDGGYVLFYSRRESASAGQITTRQSERRTPAPDPLRKEMIEALRVMNVIGSDADLEAAIAAQCPQGVRESTFEADLRAVFDRLRRLDAG